MEGIDLAYEGRLVSEEEFLQAVINSSGGQPPFYSAEEFMSELREFYCTDTLAYCVLYDNRYPGEEAPFALGYYEDTGKWIPMFPHGY